MEKKLIKIDKNGTKYYSDCTCQRCGGKGRISYYGYIYNGICFECNGSGVSKERITKVYTPEYAEKLEAKRQEKALKEKEAKIAELLAHEDEELERLGFKNGKTYCVCGDTFAIKNQLKEAGAKFSPELGWHFAELNSDYECIEILADDVLADTLIWSYGKPHFSFREDAKELVKAKMPKKEVVSEYVGELKQRMTMNLTLKRVFSYESSYGYHSSTVYINSFEDANGNVFIWKTASWCGEESKTYEVTGTVKDHSEYKGTKQTILTKCKIS